jgi:A/G-specific adenine glycosylase
MAKIGPVVLTIRHSVTRFRITLVAFKAEYQSGEARMAYYEDVRWLAPDKLRDYPLSRPQRRLADELANPHRRAIPLLNA